MSNKENVWLIKAKQHICYIKKIENWWKDLSEEDKMDVYDNMVDFLK